MLIGLSGVLLASVLGLAMITGLQIDHLGWLSMMLPSVLCATLLVLYARKVGMLRVAAMAECLLLSLSLVPSTAISSYLAVHAGFPLADPLLARLDVAMGMDAIAIVRLIDQSPDLVFLLRLAYSSFAPQLFCLPLLLCLLGEEARARRMLLAFAGTCLTASLISTFLPAVGAFASSGLSDFQNIPAALNNHFLTQFDAVRNDPAFVMRPAELEGLLTFPSVHAAVCILAVWAVWPIRVLRYPVLALNMLMMLSTISSGGHYVIDLVAGTLLAALAIGLSSHLQRLPVLPATHVRRGDLAHQDIR